MILAFLFSISIALKSLFRLFLLLFNIYFLILSGFRRKYFISFLIISSISSFLTAALLHGLLVTSLCLKLSNWLTLRKRGLNYINCRGALQRIPTFSYFHIKPDYLINVFLLCILAFDGSILSSSISWPSQALMLPSFLLPYHPLFLGFIFFLLILFAFILAFILLAFILFHPCFLPLLFLWPWAWAEYIKIG